MGEIYQHTLTNGLQLAAEPVAGANSLAMTMLVPGGVATQPQDKQGISALLSELICRGAGGKSSRQHSEALDQLGIQRSTSVQTHHLRLGAVMIGSKLSEGLPLLLDMVTSPNLAEESLEPSRDLCLQQIDSLADTPQQRALLELRRRHFPRPLGNSPLGERSAIEKITLEDIQKQWKNTFVPDGSILSFAGKFDWDQLKAQVENLLGNWSGQAKEIIPEDQSAGGYQHLEAKTSQVHIAIAYDAPSEPDDDSIYQRTAAALLSGGMSGRLFTEVREKRGLCYAISAGYSGMKDRGAMLGYAGTTTPRAQETLDVFTSELRRLSQGADENEFSRAIVGIKSHLVMQGESTSARAGAIASDIYLRSKPRTLSDLEAQVDSVTLGQLNKYLAENVPPLPKDMTIVTIGPAALKCPSEERLKSL